MNYAKYLNKTQESQHKDQTTFTAYRNGEIDIQECYDQFWENNKPRLNEAEFRDFVKSLGY